VQVKEELESIEKEAGSMKVAAPGAMMEYLKLKAVSPLPLHVRCDSLHHHLLADRVCAAAANDNWLLREHTFDEGWCGPEGSFARAVGLRSSADCVGCLPGSCCLYGISWYGLRPR